MEALTAFGVAIAVLNVGLTVYHWRLVRRARERRGLEQLEAGGGEPVE